MTDPKWTPERVEGVADAIDKCWIQPAIRNGAVDPLVTACVDAVRALRWAAAEIERLRADQRDGRG